MFYVSLKSVRFTPSRGVIYGGRRGCEEGKNGATVLITFNYQQP
jgi:hypothetical protein